MWNAIGVGIPPASAHHCLELQELKTKGKGEEEMKVS